MELEKVVAESEELPKAIVRRVVKDTLSNCSADDADINVHKDALLAFFESARIFIHYLSATANDICKESKRQTMNAHDVLKALEEIEFPEFVGPLKASLHEFKRRNGTKITPSETKEAQKKRKTQEQSKNSGGKSKQKEGNTADEVQNKRKPEVEPSKKSGGKSKQKKGSTDDKRCSDE